MIPLGLQRSNPSRPHTFIRDGQSSRIGDILYLPLSPREMDLPETTFEPEGSMDHQGLFCPCPPSILPIHRADLSHLSQPPETHLVCPIKRSQGELAQQKVNDSQEVNDFTDAVVTLGNALLDDVFKDRAKPPSQDPSFRYSEITIKMLPRASHSRQILERLVPAIPSSPPFGNCRGRYTQLTPDGRI